MAGCSCTVTRLGASAVSTTGRPSPESTTVFKGELSSWWNASLWPRYLRRAEPRPAEHLRTAHPLHSEIERGDARHAHVAASRSQAY